MRIIPKKTKVSIEFFKGIDMIDMLIILVGIFLAALVFMSDIPFKLYVIVGVLVVFGLLVTPMDDSKTYEYVIYLIRHLARPKRVVSEDKTGETSKIPMEDLMAFTGIEGEQILYGGKYYGEVIGISPIEFRFLSEYRQNQVIDNVLGAALRYVSTDDQSASIVKVDRPLIYDEALAWEQKKIEALKEAFYNDSMDEEELKARMAVIYDRIEQVEKLNQDDKVYDCFHHLVMFDKNSQTLRETMRSVLNTLKSGDMTVHHLNDKELAVFLKYNFTREFDEREIDDLRPEEYMDWIKPEELEFTSRTVKIDDIVTHNLRVIRYPTTVPNAWGYMMFNMPDTKVVMKMHPIDRNRAIKNIDRSLDELRSQEASTSKNSRLLELSGHIETLQQLLSMLQGDNEQLYDVNIYITLYDYDESYRQLVQNDEEGNPIPKSDMKRRVRRQLAEQSLRCSDQFLCQMDTFLSSQVSALDLFRKKGRAIHSSSIAAAFPFVYSHLYDPKGFKIGVSSGMPVFLDFFKRDKNRVNSNMVIIGKSGSGKSYATKMMLTNLAAEDSRIFILDPENEYTQLAKNLNGNVIDVGSATQGRINPFHIITALNDDESAGDETNVSYAVHLQFLEEYFRQILPGIDSDSMEFLNNIITRVYDGRGIDETTNLSELTPADFPTFDDLYDKLLSDYQSANSDYTKTHLRTLINYISKFATGGRNAHLWNGESTLDVKENFTVFNFQSLLANKNNTVANAQMLLTLKWLDNEIIKNRDYNLKYHASRKIVIVIDEAHVFIDPKYPVALDFMYQLAKRIRKYNGMQIVITQNVKDFVGTEDIARKSTAIINASQYSFIFPMAPNDMHDLCKLYEKAGEINETEQEEIINNGRGRAFVVTSPTNRTSIEVIVSKNMAAMFE